MKRLLSILLVLMLFAAPALAQEDAPTINPSLVLYGDLEAGYDWTFTIGDPGIVSVDGGYVTLGGDIGSVGEDEISYYEYELKGLKRGDTSITFVYANTAKADEIPPVTVAYTLLVDEALHVTILGCETDPGTK